MIVLDNDQLQLLIAPKGAELQRIYNKQLHLDYLWNADAAYWPKHSPVLFPIVGQLKDDTYIYQNKRYHLTRHGFARDQTFIVETSTNNRATFLLQSSSETHHIYPFDFELRVHYVLTDTQLSVTYDVYNTGKKEMYFSIGGHPAFKVPLVYNTRYEDYYIALEKTEEAPRWTLKNGLIDKPEPFLQYQERINLTHELFYNDALVFKHLAPGTLTLKSDKTTHGIRMNTAAFPYLGIWAQKDAPFVCIEPWQGLADSTSHNQQLEEKEGIVDLAAEHRWQQSWQATFF